MSSYEIVEQLFDKIWTEKSKGKRNERRAVAAFAADFPEVPDWFIGIRNATPTEEPGGVDVVVKTDRGCIEVQLKSSWYGAMKFEFDQKKRRYKNSIIIVILNEYHYVPFSQEEVRKTIVDRITPVYNRLQAKVVA